MAASGGHWTKGRSGARVFKTSYGAVTGDGPGDLVSLLKRLRSGAGGA